MLRVNTLKVSWFQKQIVKPWILPKNERMVLFLLLCDVLLFVFWKILKTTKRHFEIIWPLKSASWTYWPAGLQFLTLCWFLVLSLFFCFFFWISNVFKKKPLYCLSKLQTFHFPYLHFSPITSLFYRNMPSLQFLTLCLFPVFSPSFLLVFLRTSAVL